MILDRNFVQVNILSCLAVTEQMLRASLAFQTEQIEAQKSKFLAEIEAQKAQSSAEIEAEKAKSGAEIEAEKAKSGAEIEAVKSKSRADIEAQKLQSRLSAYMREASLALQRSEIEAQKAQSRLSAHMLESSLAVKRSDIEAKKRQLQQEIDQKSQELSEAALAFVPAARAHLLDLNPICDMVAITHLPTEHVMRTVNILESMPPLFKPWFDTLLGDFTFLRFLKETDSRNQDNNLLLRFLALFETSEAEKAKNRENVSNKDNMEKKYRLINLYRYLRFMREYQSDADILQLFDETHHLSVQDLTVRLKQHPGFYLTNECQEPTVGRGHPTEEMMVTLASEQRLREIIGLLFTKEAPEQLKFLFPHKSRMAKLLIEHGRLLELPEIQAFLTESPDLSRILAENSNLLVRPFVNNTGDCMCGDNAGSDLPDGKKVKMVTCNKNPEHTSCTGCVLGWFRSKLNELRNHDPPYFGEDPQFGTCYTCHGEFTQLVDAFNRTAEGPRRVELRQQMASFQMGHFVKDELLVIEPQFVALNEQYLTDKIAYQTQQTPILIEVALKKQKDELESEHENQLKELRESKDRKIVQLEKALLAQNDGKKAQLKRQIEDLKELDIATEKQLLKTSEKQFLQLIDKCDILCPNCIKQSPPIQSRTTSWTQCTDVTCSYEVDGTTYGCNYHYCGCCLDFSISSAQYRSAGGFDLIHGHIGNCDYYDTGENITVQSIHIQLAHAIRARHIIERYLTGLNPVERSYLIRKIRHSIFSSLIDLLNPQTRNQDESFEKYQGFQRAYDRNGRRSRNMEDFLMPEVKSFAMQYLERDYCNLMVQNKDLGAVLIDKLFFITAQTTRFPSVDIPLTLDTDDIIVKGDQQYRWKFLTKSWIREAKGTGPTFECSTNKDRIALLQRELAALGTGAVELPAERTYSTADVFGPQAMGSYPAAEDPLQQAMGSSPAAEDVVEDPLQQAKTYSLITFIAEEDARHRESLRQMGAIADVPDDDQDGLQQALAASYAETDGIQRAATATGGFRAATATGGLRADPVGVVPTIGNWYVLGLRIYQYHGIYANGTPILTSSDGRPIELQRPLEFQEIPPLGRNLLEGHWYRIPARQGMPGPEEFGWLQRIIPERHGRGGEFLFRMRDGSETSIPLSNIRRIYGELGKKSRRKVQKKSHRKVQNKLHKKVQKKSRKRKHK
ncbi:MAG: hypothetical protein WCJ33_02110 [Pseudomonadota bacterium]